MKITLKVGAIIVNQKNEILLIKEKYSDNMPYKWNIVKGTYDNFIETAEECIKREINEEVGVEIGIVSLRRIYNYGDNNHRRVLFLFYARIIDSETIFNFKNNQSNESIAEAKWFTSEELINMEPELFMDVYVHRSFDILKSRESKIEFFNI